MNNPQETCEQAPARANERALDTTQFLDAVLPHAGRRCIATTIAGKDGMAHAWGDANSWAADEALRADSRPGVQVFHACAGYGVDNSRKGDNVVAVRSFWLDVDVGRGKPYPDVGAAAQALVIFCQALALPKPMVVSSGRGLHAYWPLTADITPDQWRRTARLLKAAVAASGLDADPARTSDIASILRPPGTHHKKGEPTLVRLVRKAEATDYATFHALLAAVAGDKGESEDELGAVPDDIAAASWANDNSDLSANYESPPLDLERIECAARAVPAAHFRERHDWRKWIGALAAEAAEHPLHQGQLRELMHAISSQPGAWEAAFPAGYDRSKNDAEWDRLVADTQARASRGAPVITAASLFREAKLSGWTGAAAELPARVQQAADPASRRASDLLASRPPYKRKPEHGGLVHVGDLTVLNAPGGTAKTTMLVGVALALASGRPLLGQSVHRRRSVLMVNHEEPLGELLLKIQAAAKHHVVAVAALDDIAVYGAGDCPHITLTIADPVSRREVVHEAGLRQLRHLVERHRAEVVILDPLSMLLPVGMNDSGVVYPALQALKQIAVDCDCAVIVAAHTRKGGTVIGDGAEATLGSVALVNAPRTVVGLRKPTVETCKAIGVAYGEEGNVRELVTQKGNYAPSDESLYIRLVGVPMNNAQPPDYPEQDWVAVAAAFTPQPGARALPAAAMKDVIIQIARGAAGVEPYSPAKQSRGRFYAEDVATVLSRHFTGANDKKLAGAVKEAIAEAEIKGWIETYEAPVSGRNTRKGLRVVWRATPWADEPPPGGRYVV
jgi:AAA domain